MKPGKPTSIPDAATALVKQEIERHGPMTFDRFVDLALYHPVHGYYNRGDAQRGRGGDYFTSMQVGGLLPSVFADVIKALRESLGCSQFSLIELGSGGGEFLEGVLEALGPEGRKWMRVWAVERSQPARAKLFRRLTRFGKCEVVPTLDDIDWIGVEGCVFSNEFFDALPFHRLKKRGNGWKEIFVGIQDGKLADVEGELSDPGLPEQCGLTGLNVAEGVEVEARPAVGEIWDQVAARLSRGYLVTVDYGYPRAALERMNRETGTWRCFHKHALSENAYERVGAQDITADVDFTQLAERGADDGFEAQLFCSQGILLSHAGRSRIEAALAGPEREAAARAVRQLLHPDSMGERFWCLVQSRDADLPPLLSGIPNRVARLASADAKLNQP